VRGSFLAGHQERAGVYAAYDPNERKAKLGVAEKILQDDAVMVLPLFRPIYTIVTKDVNGYEGHPTQYHQFNKLWKS
jgi:peptide/nickel transport system substrate-binding protein